MKNRELKSRCNKRIEELIVDEAISLISLVITILILIILAGVAISLNLGENGLFAKAKKARDNYIVATNQEKSMFANLDKEISNYTTNGNDSTGTISNNNGEYFYESYNGYQNTLGKGKINSLYGLTATEYSEVQNDGWKYCIYEKVLNNSFNISDEFEISLKAMNLNTTSSQMGGVYVNFEKYNNETNMYDKIIEIGIIDWQGYDAEINVFVTYNGKTLCNRVNNNYSKYGTIGFIGDGTNIRIYDDDVLIANEIQQKNLSFDKINIEFKQYPGYTSPSKLYVERLYLGDIKYYKDII